MAGVGPSPGTLAGSRFRFCFRFRFRFRFPSSSPSGHVQRVGRPRFGWVKANCRWIYEKETHDNYDPKNQAHHDLVKALALDRKF